MDLVAQCGPKQRDLLFLLETMLIPLFDQLKISFVAVAGTALGAVRHQGFIPYDDDLDFAVSSSDAQRLTVHFSAPDRPDPTVWRWRPHHNFFKLVHVPSGADADVFIFGRHKYSPVAAVALPSVMMPFHHLVLPVPGQYDRYLTEVYGPDYRTVCRVWNHSWNDQWSTEFRADRCTLSVDELNEMLK